MPSPAQTAAVRSAFDTAIDAAVIDQSSLRLSGNRVYVTINGREWSAHLHMRTEAGVKDALRRCLADHCAVEAVAKVVTAA